MQPGDAVLVRGYLHNYIDGNPHMEIPDIAEEGFERIDIVTHPADVVPLALVRALVRKLMDERDEHDRLGGTRCWNCGSLTRRPDTHDPTCCAAEFDALLTAAPWLGEA